MIHSFNVQSRLQILQHLTFVTKLKIVEYDFEIHMTNVNAIQRFFHFEQKYIVIYNHSTSPKMVIIIP